MPDVFEKMLESKSDMDIVYPCTIKQARYGGTYEGGPWLGFYGDEWTIPFNAFGSDIACSTWWSKNADLVGIGSTPNDALNQLISIVKEHKWNEIHHIGINVVPYSDLPEEDINWEFYNYGINGATRRSWDDLTSSVKRYYELGFSTKDDFPEWIEIPEESQKLNEENEPKALAHIALARETMETQNAEAIKNRNKAVKPVRVETDRFIL